MDINVILDFIWTVITFIALISVYVLNHKGNLYEYAERAIAMAEDAYKDITKSGGKKFEYAVDLVYTQIPIPLRVFFTRDVLANIIQSVFDRMEDYAKTQLNKIIIDVENEIKERIDENGTSL